MQVEPPPEPARLERLGLLEDLPEVLPELPVILGPTHHSGIPPFYKELELTPKGVEVAKLVVEIEKVLRRQD